MTRSEREAVVDSICKNKIIAILRGVKKEQLIPLAEALYAGGVRLLEVTFNACGDPSDEETAEHIALLASHMAGRMYVGAGTVLTVEQVDLTKAAGGCFIISPNVSEAVIAHTRFEGLVSIPGALTPTEIVNAHEAGADFVKLFPVSGLGAPYIKAVAAPLSHVKLLAVGGVNPDNMNEFRAAGAMGFGIGANIVDKKLLASDDYEGITALARRYTDAARA